MFAKSEAENCLICYCICFDRVIAQSYYTNKNYADES